METTARDISFRVNKQVISAKQLIAEVIERIRKQDRHLQAFLSIASNAKQKANTIDELIKNRTNANSFPLKLAGVPIAVKDNIAVNDLPLTLGSKILADYISPFSATAVDLLEKEGAVVIGKTNLDEFAMGSSGEYSAFYQTKNPAYPGFVPGGSSGGSAAAVASGLVPIALGSDSGGSIRQPAAFCNVSALKPTWGSVSRYGLVPLANSLDTIGIIGKDLKDISLVFSIINQLDTLDNTSSSPCKSSYSSDSFLIPKNISHLLSPEMKIDWNNFIIRLSKSHDIKQVEIPAPQKMLTAYMIINMAESATNLSRFDCIRYGNSTADTEFITQIKTARSSLLGNEVKRRLITGNFILSEDHYAKYYQKSINFKNKYTSGISALLEESPLLMPVSPFYPFKSGFMDTQNLYKADIFTVLASICGLPALAIPVIKGINRIAGLQIIGKKFSENSIINIGQRLLHEDY